MAGPSPPVAWALPSSSSVPAVVVDQLFVTDPASDNNITFAIELSSQAVKDKLPLTTHFGLTDALVFSPLFLLALKGTLVRLSPFQLN